MSIHPQAAVVAVTLSALLFSGCKPAGEAASGGTAQPGSPGSPKPASAAPNPDGTIPSGTGVEKEKPAAGKGNVQGKVLYNGQPAEGVEVRLCETFSRFVGGCSGETFKAKTDGAGEYLIKDVPPRTYEGLIVKVFDTDSYIFATSGVVQSAKYKIEADKTYFAPDTHLFKSDLKVLSPKAAAKIDPKDIEVKWAAYPDAAYYKFSLHPDSATVDQAAYEYINKRVDGVLYVLDNPLPPGSYTVKVEAYNGSDRKLSESARDIKFTVKADAAN